MTIIIYKYWIVYKTCKGSVVFWNVKTVGIRIIIHSVELECIVNEWWVFNVCITWIWWIFRQWSGQYNNRMHINYTQIIFSKNWVVNLYRPIYWKEIIIIFIYLVSIIFWGWFNGNVIYIKTGASGHYCTFVFIEWWIDNFNHSATVNDWWWFYIFKFGIFNSQITSVDDE